MAIIDRGRAFEYFAWYTPLVVHTRFEARPDLEALERASWSAEPAGTCSRTHFHRMELEHAGRVPVALDKVQEKFPGLRKGDRQAIGDISISNRMTVRSGRVTQMMQRPPFDRFVTLSDLAG
jgi:hypothetical protein